MSPAHMASRGSQGRRFGLAAGLCSAMLAILPQAASAQATNPYLGEVITVPYTFCPQGWVQPTGQLLPISGNTALFSLLGTTYGGDGRTTFALPAVKPIFSAQGALIMQCMAMQGVFPARN